MYMNIIIVSDWRAQVYEFYSIIGTDWRAKVHELYSIIVTD